MTEMMVLEEISRLVEGLLLASQKQYNATSLADAKIVDLPLDSFDMLQLVFQLEEALKITIQTDVVFEEATLRSLASRLAGMCQ